LIPPDTFIPIAEQTGLIIALSNWVIGTACRQAATWPESVFISINLSPIEFESGDLVERIESALRESAISPGRVELEITESVMIEDAAGALEMMDTLK
ncbi:EAL domain-containing protein, partial [Pseudomonas viridiflava]|uniref:EAL domain-containing protein n=1 Tax=Pseudomonas viridiflava TaxID=33069 RepID=UPI0013C34A78